MHATGISHRHQRYRIYAYRTNNHNHRFFNLPTSDSLLNETEDLLLDHRERLTLEFLTQGFIKADKVLDEEK